MEEDWRARRHPGRRAAGQLSLTPLAALAAAHGVATGYESPRQRWRPAPQDSVRAALRVMGVACDGEPEVAAALAEAQEAPWRRMVPPCTVLRPSDPARVPLRLPVMAEVEARVHTEAGEIEALPAVFEPTGRARALRDGSARMEALLVLPFLPPHGYHRIELLTADGLADGGHLIVVPEHCPDPSSLGRAWGWMLQLYALRSAHSWGMGDLSDLRELAGWSAGQGADFAVVNPLHAVAPTRPQEPSPYYPSSRRYANPLYLDVEAVPEVQALPPDEAAYVRALAEGARALNGADRIDRDAVLAAKNAALEAAYAAMPPARADALAAYRQRHGDSLEDFATFCAIAERHQAPFQDWPEGLRHPRAPAVAAFRRAAGDRVAYHCWLQMLCEEQLDGVQRAAVSAGMGLGVIGDLAVGVDKGGADAWALQDELGLGVSVGAPPDAFNQQGQDWQQPPLLPASLRASGYRPFREMARAVLRHTGGIRIDHVIGLFRLFWVPDGAAAADGTYVRYPANDLLGVLSLEAARAGAVVIGEDLGTVEPGVRDELDRRGVLSSSVLYFERDGADGSRPRPAERYPRRALASVNTHDLPTAAGWWADEEVRLRAKLGLFGADTSEEAERATKSEDRAQMQRLLAEAGLLADDGSLEDRVAAMHAFLASTPAVLLAVSLSDAVGDLRQPNLPGTRDEYPNWRLPLAEPVDSGHRPVSLERLRSHPSVQRVIEAVIAQGRGREGS